MVGMAPVDAMSRFTFGNYQLLSGFDITVLLIGVFAVTDIVLFSRMAEISPPEMPPIYKPTSRARPMVGSMPKVRGRCGPDAAVCDRL